MTNKLKACLLSLSLILLWGAAIAGEEFTDPEPIELRSVYPQPQVEVVEVPEPGVVALMGLGLICLILIRRRNKEK